VVDECEGEREKEGRREGETMKKYRNFTSRIRIVHEDSSYPHEHKNLILTSM